MDRTETRIGRLERRLLGSSRVARHGLGYVISLGISALITLAGLLVRDTIEPTNLVMLYLLGVVSIAVLYGRGPAMVASVLGVSAFDIFLVPPYMTFAVEDTQYIITLMTLFVVGIVISDLTAKIKDQMRDAQEREARVLSLYHLGQDLAVAYSVEDVTEAITENIGSALKHDLWLFMADDETATRPPAFRVIAASGAAPREVGEAILFTYETGLPSGSGTPHLAQTDTINLPLATNTGVVGVISIAAEGPDGEIGHDQTQLLEAFASLAALALERIRLSKQASQAMLLKAKEELQSALLNSISHDFRTPLVTIIGTLGSLADESHQLDRGTRRELILDALGEAERLNRVVSNLLNISRLEAGALNLQLETVDVQDLIGATLEQMKGRLNCPVSIQMPDEPPMIAADFVLIQQALMNIVDNGVKYSPEGAPIDISVCREDERVCIDVMDRGVGIPEGELPYIFAKFYRVVDKARPGGTGLGLAIAKGVIEAHGAELTATPRPGGGMIFRIEFPGTERCRQDVEG